MTDANNIIVLDGGLGHYLKQRGVADLITGLPYEQQFLCGAVANLQRPDLITEAHLAFIRAGAQVITTNTFALTPWSLKRINQQQNLDALVKAAAVAAQQAVQRASPSHPCQIAGSLPPLEECYHASRISDMELQQGYTHLANLLAPYVDVLLCETLASAREGAIAARAAAATGKPVWVAYTLRDDRTACLRSGQPLQVALDALADVHQHVQAVLINCCAPQSITAAMPVLAAWAAAHGMHCGAYANGFSTTTSQWLAGEALQGSEEGTVDPVRLVQAEYEQGVVLPAAYAAHAAQWVGMGARVIGGCCGCGPPVIEALAAYNRSLQSRPLHTKAATSCVAFALGDMLAQRLTSTQNHQKLDCARTLRMAAFGALIAGPVGHHWYRFLDSNIGVRNPTAPRVIATKVGLDQLLFTPLSTFMFYAYLCSAEGRPSAYLNTIRDKYWATNIAGWKLWPAAHVLNFMLVPPPHRILYANVVSILGTYILSRVANKQQHAELTMDGAAILD